MISGYFNFIQCNYRLFGYSFFLLFVLHPGYPFLPYFLALYHADEKTRENDEAEDRAGDEPFHVNFFNFYAS